MLRTLLISIFIVSFLPGAAAQTGRQDYTDQLVKLVQLTDNKQYRDAIIGYRNLEAQPETPGWLRAASEYEIAELYGTPISGRRLWHQRIPWAHSRFVRLI